MWIIERRVNAFKAKPVINVEEEMAGHLEKFRLSGVTQLEYCRLNKLSYAKLVYWMRKERNQNKLNTAV